MTDRDLLLVSTQAVWSLWGVKVGAPLSPRSLMPGDRGGAVLGIWSLQHQSEQQGEFWKVWQRTGRPSPSFPGQILGLHLQ